MIRGTLVLIGLLGFYFLAISQTAPQTGKPIAKIRESVVCCPFDSAIFDGWASIVAHSEITQWIWDLNGDGKQDTICSSGELKVRAPADPSSYTVTLQVKDRKGNISDKDSTTFHVMNSPPVINVGPDTTIKSGVRVNFEPVITSNCGKPVRFEWDFNDDGKPEFRSGENGNTSRIYYKRGKYYAKFRVVDDIGRETGALRIITVQ